MAEPTDPRENRIRECAYYLWETEGRPVGRDDEFWHRASLQIENNGAAAIAKKRKERPTAAHPAHKARSRNRAASPHVTSGAAAPLA
jgi:hypothetical protein